MSQAAHCSAAESRVREYFAAFHRGDSEAYARQWVYPACLWSGGRWSSYASPAECAAANAAYERQLRADGMAAGSIVALESTPLTESSVWVRGTFTRERSDGTLLATIRSSYVVVDTADGWRIATCLVESAR